MDSSVRWNDGFPAPVIPGPLAEPGIHCCKTAETAESLSRRTKHGFQRSLE